MCSFNHKLPLVGLGISCLILCLSCQSPSDSQLPVLSLPKSTTKIDGLRQPERVERSVSLTGSVTQRLAILNGWLYQLDDGTGQLWVLTRQTAPAVGQQVQVDGVLSYEAIPINGIDLGDYYLEEQQRQLQSTEG